MSDILAPVFEDRNTRLSSFSDEQRSQLELTAKNSGDPEFLDRQFSAMWLSRRTGLPHDEVVKNFDGLSRLYFGEGATPSKAYDSISGLYKRAGGSSDGSGETGGETAAEQPASPYSVSGTVIAKDIAGSLSAGAAKMGYDALGGIYSNLAAATGVKLKRPSDSAEYNDLLVERGMLTLKEDTLGISASAYGIKKGSDEYKELFAGVDTTAADARLAEIKKRTAEIEAQVKVENDAILDEIDRNDFKWMASKGVEVLRGVSNLFYELSQESPSAMGVRPEFTETMVGSLTQTAGSLPVTALFAYLGPVVGGGATYGSIYGQVEQERQQFQGEDYDPNAAFLANAVSAGPQAVMEFAFGMERMMGNVLKATPKIGGRVAFGDALKVMGKRGLASGIEEGITEPTQNFWNDYVASLSYDEKRELLTPEAFKQRFIDGITAFAFGSLFGGGVSGIDLIDRNRGVAKAEKHLTTRNGQPFTPYDWAALRTAKTDDEIKGMAPDPGMADIYLAAANGNPEAQAAYFKDVQERAFVETDGLSAHGMTIGKSGDAVAIRNADGSVITLDPANKEHAEFLLQLQADAVQLKNELEQREGATSETIKEFEKRFGDQVQIERMQMQTLSELTKSGVITADQEADALAAAQEINKALTGEGEVQVQGIASLTTDERTGAIRMAAKIAEGVEPTVVVEEVAESWYKKALAEGQLDPAELTAHRQKWHAQEGEADPVADGKVTAQRADIEWFSKRVIDYALANRKTELPGGWGKWLRALGERLKAILRGAARMKKLLRDGKIDPQLEAWMQQALGAQAEKPAATQIQQRGEPGGLMSTFSLESDFREEAKKRRDAAVKNAITSDGTKSVFGTDLDNNYAAQEILSEIAVPPWAKWSGWERTKWGSYYAELTDDESGDTFKLSVKDHEQRRTDMQKPDYTAYVDRNWNPESVAKATQKVEDWIASKWNYFPDEGQTFSLANAENKPVAPAKFLGIQEGIPGKIADIELWNLTKGIEGNPAGSTVSRQTIEKAGFYLPPAPSQPITRDDLTFAITGIPQNKTQAMQAKLAQFRAQQAATFPYPYHQLAALPAQARISGKGHEVSVLAQWALPMSERLRYISDKLGINAPVLSRVRRYYFEKGELLKKYSDMVTPLMRGLTRLNATDLREWSVAASNQDALNRDRLTAKYGLQNEWAQYTAARDQLRAEMLAAGIDVGLIDEYFPRWVKDVVGLRQSLGMEASESPLEQAVIDAEKSAGRTLTAEEVNDVIDAAVRGIQFGGNGTSAPSNAKQRKIQTIGPAQWEFYADANHALSRWLEQSTERIARHRFFGKNTVALPNASILAPTKIDLNASIGAIIREQLDAGNISATQQKEIQDILDGLFAYHGKTNAFIRGVMDLSYVATMGKLSSAMAQAVDLMVAVYETGPLDVALAVPQAMWRNAKNLPGIGNVKSWSEAVGKFTKGKDWLTREQLGVDRIMDEFRDQRFTARALNQVFTAVGLNFMDGIGKDTLVNVKHRQLARQAKRGQLSRKNQQLLVSIFGEQAARGVIADFAAGKKTDDTLFAVYNVLADWQPISLAEYPEAYAKHPRMRFLYMLKSYSIKMLGAYRREGFMKMWYGNKAQKIEGARNLAYLLGLLLAAGVTKDWLVDFMLDRDPQLDDITVDNLFKLGQVSRYAVWQQRNRNTAEGTYGFIQGAGKIGQNIKQIIVDTIAPPFTLIERPAKDVSAWAEAREKGDAYDVLSSESIQFVPGAGEFLYWSGERGRAKIERRRQLRERDRNPRRRRDRD